MHSRERVTPLLVFLLLLLAGIACSPGEPVDAVGEEVGTEIAGGGAVSTTETEDGASEGATATGEQPRDGGTLVVALGSEADSLDPHLSTTGTARIVFNHIFDKLVALTEDQRVEPRLAKSWEVSDDQLTWTFELEEDVTFHNGREFTAEDVVYNFERALDPEVGSRLTDGLVRVDGISAIDDYTVEIQLSEPRADFPGVLGSKLGPAILARESVEDGNSDLQPVGTGAFRFVSLQANGDIIVERNEDYWREGLPYLDGIVMKAITDAGVRLTNLETEDVHWAFDIPAERVQALAGSTEIVTQPVVTNDYWYLTMNKTQAPFDDVRVRQAMAYAVDLESVAEAATFDENSATSTGMPESNPWYHEYAPFERDLDEARRLLEEAGLGDGFEFELMVASNFDHTVRAAQVLQSQLAEVNITATINQTEFATMLSRRSEGDYETFIVGWLGLSDPQEYYWVHHSSDDAFYEHGYDNPEWDALMLEALGLSDFDERKALYDQAVEIIVDDVSYLHLYNPPALIAWRPALHGYDNRVDTLVDFTETWLAAE